MIEFNIDIWFTTLLMTPEYYSNLSSYVHNKESKMLYLENVKIFTGSVNLTKTKAGNTNEIPIYDYDNYESKKFVLDEIEKAFSHYCNQMIVIFSSYLELIGQDFFESLFYYQPEKMYDYIPFNLHDELKGYVELKLIIESSSIDELKLKLAKRAALNANRGGILKVISRIEKLCNYTFNEKLKNELKILVKYRNEVVHEGKLFDVNVATVYRISENLKLLLQFFGSYLLKNNIPIVNKSKFIK